MGGTVYLRTDRFEVKLEGITFKTKDFEALCKMGFLFADGKTWARRPIIGMGVMYHPRDPSVLLLLLCFGLGCVILRFGVGEALPAGIHKFLADKRIHVVGFGIPEKIDLFPFEELGLTKHKSDIGYLAAKTLKDPKYKRSELDSLARKILGIKKMIGLTEASTFERHEQIKGAICQLFITTLVAMGLSGANDKKKTDSFSKKTLFFKNLNSLHLLAEGWFKLPKVRKKKAGVNDDSLVHTDKMVDNNMFDDKNALVTGSIVDVVVNTEIPDSVGECWDLASPKGTDDNDNDNNNDTNNNNKRGSSSPSSDEYEKKKPIKGILKCPSTTLLRGDSVPITPTMTPPVPSTPTAAKDMLKRANSKGCNVRFQCH